MNVEIFLLTLVFSIVNGGLNDDITVVHKFNSHDLQNTSPWKLEVNDNETLYSFTESHIYLGETSLLKEFIPENGVSRTKYSSGPHFQSCSYGKCEWTFNNYVKSNVPVDWEDIIYFDDNTLHTVRNISNMEFISSELSTKIIGTVSSPNYPNNYDNNKDIYYRLEAPSGSRITLMFMTFNLERGSSTLFDYLKVYDGDSTSGTLLMFYSGTLVPPAVKSSGSSLYLHFHSDGSNTRKGFYAVYFTDSQEHVVANMLEWKRNLTRMALRELGKIYSPNFPNDYDNNNNRYHTLTTSTPGSHVTLSFSSFQLEWTPKWDYVRIYDGTSTSAPLLGTYAGSSLPPTITSSGNSLYVHFHSDGTNVFKGYSASYYDDPYPEGVMVEVFNVHSQSVSIRSPVFNPILDQICIGVMYRTNYSDGYNLKVSVEIQNSIPIDIGFIDMKQANVWQYQRFIANLTLEEQQKKMSIVISGNKIVSSSAFFMRSIEECNPSRLQRRFVVPDLKITEDFGTISREHLDCINGGMLYNNSCICPAGFTGKNCEIGCGSNRFGSSCDNQCSNLDTDCKEHVLCSANLPCSCAPGYKGSACNIECDNGEYGAGCRQKCNKCAGDGSCNPYTGACNHGCVMGYYPPLCHYRLPYFTVAPTVTVNSNGSVNVVISVNDKNGRGNPKFIQFQYKESTENNWIKTEYFYIFPATSSQFHSEILGLHAGKWYEIRAVILDESLIGYEGAGIPYKEFETLCSIPPSPDFRLRSNNVSSKSISLIWNYPDDVMKWCPLSSFEVYLLAEHSWLLYWNGTDNETTLTNLQPGKQYYIKLRATTVNGTTDFSNILKATTLYERPGPVTKLHASSAKPHELEVFWEEPLDASGGIKHYVVRYKCDKLVGCELENCSYLHDEVEVKSSHIILRGLIPHAKYIVSVSAVSENEGQVATINAATDHTVPEVSPVMLQEAVTHQTNTSFTVHWNYPQNCTGINGFFYHYQYELTDESGKYLLQGSTRNTSVTFSGLTSDTEYAVKVYLVTSGGTNNGYPLLIQAFTKGRVPPKVENLSVYKKSRNMVGLRWASPKVSYGIIESFTITYSTESEEEEVSVIANPIYCRAWPKKHCYTLNSLQPETLYTIQVSAKYTEVEENGEWTSVNVTTKEQAPDIPENLAILNQTESSLSVSWKLPQKINGFLRSFLVTIEQTDSFNSSNCCQDFPVKIMPVYSEQEYYQYEFAGLKAASTYTISISAKTSAMGPAAIVTGNTKPPKSSVIVKLKLEQNSDTSLIVKVSAVSTYEKLIKGYLLLVIPQHTSENIPDLEIWNHNISEELLSSVEDPFYIAAEFEQSELEENSEVELGTGHPPLAGRIARIQDPSLVADGRYRLALAAILEYCGVFNIAYTLTQDFSLTSLINTVPAN